MDWLRDKPLIGMIHLAPLPGAPRAGRDGLASVLTRALADADALVEGGCQALLVENFGDAPFYPDRVPAHVVAAMTRVAAELVRRVPLPLGINVLRNDGRSALAIAAAVGARFIRVNVLTGARVTDQGTIQGIAHDLARERVFLGATGIGILADVDVKHSAPLAARPLQDEVKDVLARGMADAVVVSGSGTGAGVDEAKLALVKKAAGSAPVLIGSGATAASLASLAKHADAFIVGTATKRDGDVLAPVDLKRVQDLAAARRALTGI
jgi:membrane complex biogenesis BtpA family protein